MGTDIQRVGPDRIGTIPDHPSRGDDMGPNDPEIPGWLGWTLTTVAVLACLLAPIWGWMRERAGKDRP